jgi:hypothetical protein
MPRVPAVPESLPSPDPVYVHVPNQDKLWRSRVDDATRAAPGRLQVALREGADRASRWAVLQGGFWTTDGDSRGICFAHEEAASGAEPAIGLSDKAPWKALPLQGVCPREKQQGGFPSAKEGFPTGEGSLRASCRAGPGPLEDLGRCGTVRQEPDAYEPTLTRVRSVGYGLVQRRRN